MKIPIGYSIASLMQRPMRTLLSAGGVGVVILIACAMLGMSRGLVESAKNTAEVENIIVMSQGAETMQFSALDPAEVHLLSAVEGVDHEDGRALISPEAYVNCNITLPQENPGTAPIRSSIVRGVLPIAPRVHQRVTVTDGRMPERGREIAIGSLVATKLEVPDEALQVGKTLAFENVQWTIVGHFSATGTSLDAEIWAPVEDLMAATRRNDYSAVTYRISDPQARDDFLLDMEFRTDVLVFAQPETAYYRAIAQSLWPVQTVSWIMTALLVSGGALVGMNTMFTSILGRTREMAILMILGYKRKAVLIAFVLESLLLCCVGGVAGTLLATLLNGFAMRIPLGAFRFIVDPLTMLVGMILALCIGMIGAFLPVMRVARMKAVEALRSH